MFKHFNISKESFLRDLAVPSPYWIFKSSPTSSPSGKPVYGAETLSNMFDTPKALYDPSKLPIKGKSQNVVKGVENYSTSIPSIIIAAYRLHRHPVLFGFYTELMSVFKPNNLIKWISEISSVCGRLFPGTLPYKTGPLGRLGFIEEAAGKVRVVAMVDC